jgi:hypothetical protein
MIAINGNLGSWTMIPCGLRKRRFLAGAAVATMLMTALPVMQPTPAAAQTFVIGGFRIHVHGLGGGGYYSRHRSSRHASTSSRRHARRRGGDQEEETAAKTAPAPQAPAAAPVIATPVAEGPVTSANRPLLHGPDIEPSK